MLTLSARFDRRGLEAMRARRLNGVLLRVSRAAGASGMRRLDVDTRRLIRQRKAFSAQGVKRAVTIERPRPGARLEDLTWTLRISGKPVPLAAFPHRQARQGVSVEINKGRRVVVKRAFMATMKSGHKGIFRRDSAARLPITELFSTRVTDVLADEDAIPQLVEAARREFQSTFTRMVPIELGRA